MFTSVNRMKILTKILSVLSNVSALSEDHKRSYMKLSFSVIDS
jgi:hypothetical protein